MRPGKIGIAALITLLAVTTLPAISTAFLASQVLAQTSDARTTEAGRLLEKGVQQFSNSQVEAAAQSFQQALTIYREVQDRKGEWSALYFLGIMYSSIRDFTKALDYLQQSLVIAQKISDRPKEADSLKSLGTAQAALGNTAKAVEYFQQSLMVARAIPDRYKEAQVLESLSDAYKVLGDTAKAEEYQRQRAAIAQGQPNQTGNEQERMVRALKEGQQLSQQETKESLARAIAKYEEALSLARTLQERTYETIALVSIGSAYQTLGEKQKALGYYNQALPLSHASNNRFIEITTLVAIGSIYSDLGEKQKALGYYNQALPLSRAAADPSGQSTIINNIARLYADLGEYLQALDYYNQSLSLARTVGDRSKEATAFNNIGQVYAELGEYQRALDNYDRALPIARGLKERLREATVLGNISTVYFFLGQKQKALDYLQQALLLERDAGERSYLAVTLANMATIYSDLGENQKALDYYNQSLSLVQALKDPFQEATVLSNIGGVYFDTGANQKALDYYNQALPLARKIGQKAAETATLGKMGQVYYVLGDYSKATEYLQQSLAMARKIGDRRVEGKNLNALGRVFLASGKFEAAQETLLDGIKVWESIRAGLGSNDINKVSIFEEQAVTYRLLQKALLAQNKTDVALEIAERGRSRAFVELLAKRLQAKGSNFSSNPQPLTLQSPTIEQIKKIAKEQNATLVEYSLIYDDLKIQGPPNTESPLELFIWVIQPTGEVAFRQVDLKSLSQQNFSLEKLVTNSRESIGVRGRGLAVVGKRDEVRQTGQLKQLHKLLVQPIADILPKDPNARVIFMPQKSLFLVPFAALQDNSGKYLVEKHTILTAPAIQVLDLTHKQRQSISGKEALVVGNPIMPKIGEPPQPLEQLPGAEKEALAIAQLLQTKAITGDRATKASIVQAMPKAKMIHLATHGLLDDFKGLGVPGAIALAPSGSDNGLLTASEILELKLNAELVVLSACDTGRGTITGDGVIGLSRSLISSGVPSVLVSLWSVPDAPTASLMTEFYKNLLSQPDKAQALRQAMLATMKQHPDPKDWAAFTLIGEAD